MSTAVLKLLGNGFVALGYECPEELRVKEKCACVWLCLEIIFLNLVECDRKLRCRSVFVTIKGVRFKGFKCVLEDFLNGKFAGHLPLSAAVPSAFSLPAVEGVSSPNL